MDAEEDLDPGVVVEVEFRFYSYTDPESGFDFFNFDTILCTYEYAQYLAKNYPTSIFNVEVLHP